MKRSIGQKAGVSLLWQNSETNEAVCGMPRLSTWSSSLVNGKMNNLPPKLYHFVTPKQFKPDALHCNSLASSMAVKQAAGPMWSPTFLNGAPNGLFNMPSRINLPQKRSKAKRYTAVNSTRLKGQAMASPLPTNIMVNRQNLNHNRHQIGWDLSGSQRLHLLNNRV